jgi:NADPH-dependent 2,4-dienoyl-CoA reductase/sulfur reductase-like enzyme
VVAAMRSLGIDVITGVRIERICGTERVEGVDVDGHRLEADLVVLGLGSRPEVELAAVAGIPLGMTGAIAVDDRQRTHRERVWSAGDCAEATHRVTGGQANFHLGTVANKTGRVAGINIGGGDARFPGVLGTTITRVCDVEIGSTGLRPGDAVSAGFEVKVGDAEGTTTAGYWPDATPMRIRAVTDRLSGRLLGAQIVGGPGAGKRIDVFATAIWNGMGADDLAWTDLAYAPPFSGVWDLIHIAARRAGSGE